MIRWSILHLTNWFQDWINWRLTRWNESKSTFSSSPCFILFNIRLEIFLVTSWVNQLPEKLHADQISKLREIRSNEAGSCSKVDLDDLVAVGHICRNWWKVDMNIVDGLVDIERDSVSHWLWLLPGQKWILFGIFVGYLDSWTDHIAGFLVVDRNILIQPS